MKGTVDDEQPDRRQRILLLEPIQLLATLWLRVLAEESTFEPIVVVNDPQRALEQLEAFDLVVTGPSLSREQAMEFTRTATASQHGVRVVVTGIAQSEAAVVQAAEAGAVGLVMRRQSIDEALEAIRAAGAGEARISPEVAPLLMARLAELKVSQPDVDTVGRRYLGLTPREREVLGLIGGGLTNKQIADRLVVELGTVKNHVHRILEKLDKSSREEAAGYLHSLPVDFTEPTTPEADDSKH